MNTLLNFCCSKVYDVQLPKCKMIFCMHIIILTWSWGVFFYTSSTQEKIDQHEHDSLWDKNTTCKYFTKTHLQYESIRWAISSQATWICYWPNDTNISNKQLVLYFIFQPFSYKSILSLTIIHFGVVVMVKSATTPFVSQHFHSFGATY